MECLNKVQFPLILYEQRKWSAVFTVTQEPPSPESTVTAEFQSPYLTVTLDYHSPENPGPLAQASRQGLLRMKHNKCRNLRNLRRSSDITGTIEHQSPDISVPADFTSPDSSGSMSCYHTGRAKTSGHYSYAGRSSG